MHVWDVGEDFEQNKSNLMSLAQRILDSKKVDAKVYDMKIIGSYATMSPTKDSDVDLEIKFYGNASEEDKVIGSQVDLLQHC